MAAPMTAPAAARAAASSTPGTVSASAMARSVSWLAARTAADSDGVPAARRIRSRNSREDISWRACSWLIAATRPRTARVSGRHRCG